MHGAGRRAHWCAIGGFLAHPRAGAQVSLDSMPHARSPPRQNARSMLEWDLMESSGNFGSSYVIIIGGVVPPIVLTLPLLSFQLSLRAS